MLNHASKLETMVDILNRATPLFLSGIAAAIGFRMNLFNIGVEGQYLLAALVAAAGRRRQSTCPAPCTCMLILLVAMTVGAAYAGIAGVLKVTRGVNEVISTIMLNAIATSGLIVAGLKLWQAGGPSAATSPESARRDPESGRIPNLNSMVEIFTRDIGHDRKLTGVFVVAIIVGVTYHVLSEPLAVRLTTCAPAARNPLQPRPAAYPEEDDPA